MSSLNRRSLLKLMGISTFGILSSTGAASSQVNKIDVILKPKSGKKEVIKDAVRNGQGKLNKEYKNFEYISITVPEQALRGLKNNPNVDSIEKDVQMKLVSNKPSFAGKGKQEEKKKPNRKTNTNGNSSKKTNPSPKNPKESNLDQDSTSKQSGDDSEQTSSERSTDEEQVKTENTKEEVESTGTVSSWGIERIGAYNTSIEDSSSSVAVIDTGIEASHDDLIVQDQEDFTGEGVGDKNGHGTHVAGIIAADGDLIGTSPSADLYSVKVLNSNGSGSLSDVIAGIDWAMQQNIEVMNLSLGTSTDSSILHETVKTVRDKGHIIISSAGNNGNNQDGSCEEQNIVYPAKYNSVISVSSMNQNENISSFSSVGDEVDIMAPGSSIPSTYLNNEYIKLSGTSMASPHVSGVVSLLIDVGYTTPSEIETRLKNTSERILDSCSEGSGLVNAESAVANTNDTTDGTEDGTEEETTESSTDEETDDEETEEREEDEKENSERPKRKPTLPDQASEQAKKILSRIFG